MGMLVQIAGGVDAAARFARASIWPLLDLLIRFWLAEAIWRSGMVKALDWDRAVLLATVEYPVAWMAPETAALVGMLIEVVGPPLLLIGLATRFAALAMAALLWVSYVEYLAFPVVAFQAALLSWFVVAGPGPLSADRFFGKGVSSLPLPLFGQVTALFSWSRRVLAPVFLVGLRLLVAWMVIASILLVTPPLDQALLQLGSDFRLPLPPPGFGEHVAPWLAIALAGLVAVGLFARIAALALIAITAAVQAMIMGSFDLFYWDVILMVIAVLGPGPLAFDTVLTRLILTVAPEILGRFRTPVDEQPRVVIIGAGFGGISAARALADAPVRISLIDQHNYHLFQPLLYQVATAALSPADIATPIRSIFRDQANCQVVFGRVDGIDPSANEVSLTNGLRIGYDTLILATGAQHGYFGNDQWAPYAPGLKRVDDATEIRRRLLVAFERAENAETEAERRRLLTFVVVGGGPTGVELSGSIAELARHGMEDEFRTIDPADAHVILAQGAPRLLPPFTEAMSEETRRALEAMGVDVRLDTRVEEIDDTGVIMDGERLPAGTVFWAAGVVASPAARWLEAEADRAGRIMVGDDLSVPGHPNIFAVGDTALSLAWGGKPVPGLAPAAKQGGKYVAAVIRARIAGRPASPPFRYKHMGNLATIGRKAAVVEMGPLKLRGAIAWWLWGAAHVLFLATMRNRIAVAFEWVWAYLSYRRSTRLITGGDEG